MAKMTHDDFESWIRERSCGCMEQYEIDYMCRGFMDFDSGEYTFRDSSVQGQWEAWQASHESKSLMDAKEIDKLQNHVKVLELHLELSIEIRRKYETPNVKLGYVKN